MYIGYIFDFKPYNQFHIKGEKQQQICRYKYKTQQQAVNLNNKGTKNPVLSKIHRKIEYCMNVIKCIYALD